MSILELRRFARGYAMSDRYEGLKCLKNDLPASKLICADSIGQGQGVPDSDIRHGETPHKLCPLSYERVSSHAFPPNGFALSSTYGRL